MGHYQVDQYSHYRSPKKNRRIKNGRKMIWKKIANNFPNMGKETSFQILEDNTVPRKMNPKRLKRKAVV